MNSVCFLCISSVKNDILSIFFEKMRKKRAFLLFLLVYSYWNFHKRSFADVFLACMDKNTLKN